MQILERRNRETGCRPPKVAQKTGKEGGIYIYICVCVCVYVCMCVCVCLSLCVLRGKGRQRKRATGKRFINQNRISPNSVWLLVCHQ